MATRPELAGEGMARCTGPRCGRVVRWVLTVGGKRMPLDVEPSLDGNVVPATMPDGTVRARVLTGAELPAQRPCWVPHHRTCVDGDDFRRRKAATAPQCRAGCGVRMDPWLIERGWRWHVGCAPLAEFRAYMHRARTVAAERKAS